MEATEDTFTLVDVHLQLILTTGIILYYYIYYILYSELHPGPVSMKSLHMCVFVYIYRRSKMFWTDDTYNRIWMANLNGTNATLLINSDLSCPGGAGYKLPAL